MTREQYLELKAQLKEEAKVLRSFKYRTRQTQSDYAHGIKTDISPATLQYQLYEKKREYRCKHVFYCLLKGRTMEQIENNFGPYTYESKYVSLSVEKFCQTYNLSYDLDEHNRVISIKRDWIKTEAA